MYVINKSLVTIKYFMYLIAIKYEKNVVKEKKVGRK